MVFGDYIFARKIYMPYNETRHYERIAMTLKEKIAFGLYVAVAVTTVAQATVEITRNVKQAKRARKNLEAIAAEQND
jgi:hypothetical protein